MKVTGTTIELKTVYNLLNKQMTYYGGCPWQDQNSENRMEDINFKTYGSCCECLAHTIQWDFIDIKDELKSNGSLYTKEEQTKVLLNNWIKQNKPNSNYSW